MILAAISLSPIGLATAFAAGFVSFVSPCVLPLVPAYLSFVSGVGYGDLQQNTRRVTMATGVFVLGFTIVFSAYGAGVGWAGSLLNDYRRSLELIGGFLMILMGLALIGFATRVFGREYGVHWKPGQASFAGALLTGAAFAIGWTPCIGPVLSAILTFAAQTGPGAGRGAAGRLLARARRPVPDRGPRDLVDAVGARRLQAARRAREPHRRHRAWSASASCSRPAS